MSDFPESFDKRVALMTKLKDQASELEGKLAETRSNISQLGRLLAKDLGVTVSNGGNGGKRATAAELGNLRDEVHRFVKGHKKSSMS
jgi:hypothetical protein